MNMENRKGYLDRMRKDQAASLCPACGRKTRHFTVPSKEGEGACDVLCEWCNQIVKTGIQGVKPYIPYRIYADGWKEPQYDKK